MADAPNAVPVVTDVVNPSAVPPAIKSVVSDIVTVAAFYPVITALVGKHDTLGLISAVSGSQGAMALAAVCALGATGWRAWLRIKRWTKAVKWARSADDSVAVVKEASPAPSV